MFRRRSEVAEPARLASARTAILGADPSSPALGALDDVARAVQSAEDDRVRLRKAIQQLDPERATHELKAALRSRTGPDVPDTAHIEALRRRYESIHAVKNRYQELGSLIETAFADAETLAATVVTAAAIGGDAEMSAVGALVDRMTQDARALEAAHREVAEIESER